MPPELTQPDLEDEMGEPNYPTFKIFSGVLKAFEKDVNGTSRKYLRCTASSTTEDLHGDNMTDDCVLDMAPQAKAKGMTIFLNHSYKWPEDVAGKTVDATVTQRALDANGKPIYDLDLEIELNESNQRALDSYTAIKEQGIKAGISIGAMILDYAFKDEDEGWWGGLEIKKVDLLEASIVGIPANQRSWVINGLQALGAPKAILRKAAGLPERKTVKTATPTPAEEPPVTKSEDPAPPAEPEAETVTDVEASAAPEGETPAEGGDTSTDDADASTESPDEKSAPEPATVVAELKEAGLSGDLLEITLGFLEGATEEVASLRKTVKALTDEQAEYKRQLQEAAEVVETIARTPLGRKAGFAGPVSTFRQKFGAIYDESFIKMLESKENE